MVGVDRGMEMLRHVSVYVPFGKLCAIPHSLCNYLFTFFRDRSRAMMNRSA